MRLKMISVGCNIMERYKVSIVVAIYKSEKFLHKLIDSIINQTHRNLEVILVDDGSPDHSGQICDEYADMDKRIRVIHKENGGACEARNVGIEAATGEYISIIDGDDWLELDYVEYLLKMIVDTDSDLAMTDAIFTTRNRKQTDRDWVEVLSPADAASRIIYPIVPIGPWNKLYKRGLIENNNLRFTRPWSGEGLCFTAEAAQYSQRVVLGHRKIYNYRLNNSGSGLTNYNLTMATNALENILYLKNNRIIQSRQLLHAINWHVWKNHGFVIHLIIATNSMTENKILFRKCKQYLRRNLLQTLVTAKIGMRMKRSMVFEAMLPVTYNKRKLKKEELERKKDVME